MLGERGSPKIDQRASLAYLIKAFNAFVEGRSVSILLWRPGAGEPFPKLTPPPTEL